MAAVQSSYSETMRVGFPGMVANSETQNIVTRTAGGDIGFGQPVRRNGDHGCLAADELALTAAAVAGVPAPAGATITAVPTAVVPAKPGAYRAEAIVGGAGTASKWRVTDPEGEFVGVASGNTAFALGGLGFTITDTGTDPAVGEAFEITVTEEADAPFLGITVRDVSLPPTNDPIDVYAIYDSVAVMTQGVVWVMCGDTVAAGAPVFWDEADARFTDVVTDYPMLGWVFDTSGVDAALVRIAKR